MTTFEEDQFEFVTNPKSPGVAAEAQFLAAAAAEGASVGGWGVSFSESLAPTPFPKPQPERDAAELLTEFVAIIAPGDADLFG